MRRRLTTGEKVRNGLLALGAVWTLNATPADASNGNPPLTAAEAIALGCVWYDENATMDAPMVDILNGSCRALAVGTHGLEQASAQFDRGLDVIGDWLDG